MRWLPWILVSLLMVIGCDEAEPDEPPGRETAGGSEGEAPPEEPIGGEGTGRTSPDGMCGGFAGFMCPEGQWCDLEGDYPDASGTCRAEGACDAPTDCEQQDLVHAMCVGAWTCAESECAWECS